MNLEASMKHTIFQFFFPYLASTKTHKRLPLCFFWIFLLAPYAILGSQCVCVIDKFYYHLRRSNITYETKNITFNVIHVKVSRDSRCSRTLPMNVAIESAYCGCERNSCKDWARLKRCRKHGRI